MNRYFSFSPKRKKGFSLVELFLVLLITAVLAGAVFLNMGIGTNAAKAKKCAALRKQIEMAEQFYMFEQDAIPADFQVLVDAGYLERMPECPSGGELFWMAESDDAAFKRVGCMVHLQGEAAEPEEPEEPEQSALFDKPLSDPSVLGDMIFVNGSESNWTVTEDGLLVDPDSHHDQVLFRGTEGADYRITLDATLLSGQGPYGYGIVYRGTIDENDRLDGYRFQFDPGAGKKFLFKRVSDTYSEKTIASANMPKDFDVNAPHTVTVEVSGNTHTAYVDGVEVLSATDDTYESGMVGLRKWDVSNPEAEVLFEDLVVEALP